MLKLDAPRVKSPSSHHHLYSFCYSLLTMDVLKLLSKKTKKIRHRLTGRKHKPDGTGADTSEERSDSASSHLRTNPSQPDDPGSTPPDKGKIGREGRNVRIGEGEITQTDPHLLSDVDIVEEAGPSREGNDADGEETKTSALAIPPNLEPRSKWA